MFEDEIKTERADELVNIIDNILDFNNQNKEGQELKILPPNQMLSRLPISLAQLQTGSHSEKIKNETRQVLYSLYKKLAKTIYNNLINTI